MSCFFKELVGKLLPVGQIQPNTCFYKFLLDHSLACLFIYCLCLL